MSISSKKRQRSLGDLIAQVHDGIQANYYRSPGCSNFGVPPRRLDPTSSNPHSDRFGAYALFGPEGGTLLNCGAKS